MTTRDIRLVGQGELNEGRDAVRAFAQATLLRLMMAFAAVGTVVSIFVPHLLQRRAETLAATIPVEALGHEGATPSPIALDRWRRRLIEHGIVQDAVIRLPANANNEAIVLAPLGAQPVAAKSPGMWLPIVGSEGKVVGEVSIRVENQSREVLWIGGAIGAALLYLIGSLQYASRRESRTIAMEVVMNLRQALRRAERRALAADLAAGLMHDLRKPVLAMRAVAEDADDPAAPWAKAVRDHANAYIAMAKQSGWERLGRGTGEEREWCDLHQVVERAARLVEHERDGVALDTELNATAVLFEAPPAEALQLVSNLVLNALQALRGVEGGRVLVTTSDVGRTSNRSQSDGSPTTENVQLIVADNGPGIPKEMRERLFQLFATGRAEQGGSGLGLYICRDIARSLGGTIEYREADGGGAQFVVTLPARRPE